MRSLTSRQLTHTLPGAPDGTHVVLTYQSQFEHKKSTVETVTPMLDTDGRGGVSGDFIREAAARLRRRHSLRERA